MFGWAWVVANAVGERMLEARSTVRGDYAA
jgi:hypothetical protein